MSSRDSLIQSRLTFDAYDDAGAPRLFVGMFRPPFEEASAEFHSRRSEASQLWYRVGEDREAWLRGDFDKPLYEAMTK